MLIACYNVYNEIEYLAKSVKSIYNKVEKIVFVDGRYKGFFDDRPVQSTDGTVEWIKDKDNDPKGKFHLIKAPKQPWANQAVKRSAYLIGEVGDSYFVVDGHELLTDWRCFDLIGGVAGFARIDLFDRERPLSVRMPRLFPHAPGLRYHTHSYLVTPGENGEDNLFLNCGWDHQSVFAPDRFLKEIPSDMYCCVLRHYGDQNTKTTQRQEQVRQEREKIQVFDHAKGLNFKVDSRTAIDRVTKRLLPGWNREAALMGLPQLTFQQARYIVAMKAEQFEKQNRLKVVHGRDEKLNLTCSKCGFIASNTSMMARHFQETRHNL